jgi:hypothetical protein
MVTYKQGQRITIRYTATSTGSAPWEGIVGASLVGPQVIDGTWEDLNGTLPPGQSISGALIIDIPRNAALGTYDLQVKAWASVNLPGTIAGSDGNFTIYTAGSGSLNLALDQYDAIVIIEAADAGTLAVQINSVTLS